MHEKKHIRIFAEFKKERSEATKPHLKQIYWYDDFYKQGHTFNCSKLNYKSVDEYYLDTPEGKKPVTTASQHDCGKFPIKKAKRLIAEPEIFEVSNSNKVISVNSIKDWFKKYVNYNNSNSRIDDENSKGVIFLVPEQESEHFTYQLERSGFLYRIL